MHPATSSTGQKSAGGGGATSTITDLHPDVLTHILRRLDGPSLASASCATSLLQKASSDHDTWQQLCHETWPSVKHPRVVHLISNFQNGYFSFFSDSFPFLSPTLPSLPPRVLPLPAKLISSVDLHYKQNLIFSKVLETETLTDWFLTVPFQIDLFDGKPTQPTEPILSGENLAGDLTLSWIVVDPVRNRAADLSSRRPVSVTQHWFSGEIQVRFATILSTVGGGMIQCGILVTCGWCEGGELHVREASLRVEDIDGISFNGRDSLGILQRVIGVERRKRKEEEFKERYMEYVNAKRKRKEQKMRREGRIDMIYEQFFGPFSYFVGRLKTKKSNKWWQR